MICQSIWHVKPWMLFLLRSVLCWLCWQVPVLFALSGPPWLHNRLFVVISTFWPSLLLLFVLTTVLGSLWSKDSACVVVVVVCVVNNVVLFVSNKLFALSGPACTTCLLLHFLPNFYRLCLIVCVDSIVVLSVSVTLLLSCQIRQELFTLWYAVNGLQILSNFHWVTLVALTPTTWSMQLRATYATWLMWRSVLTSPDVLICLSEPPWMHSKFYVVFCSFLVFGWLFVLTAVVTQTVFVLFALSGWARPTSSF